MDDDCRCLHCRRRQSSPAETLPRATRSDEVDVAETAERRIVDLAGRGLAPFLSFGHYRYLHAHDPLPPQVHDSLLLLALPLRGAVPFTVDATERVVVPGSVLSVPAGHVYVTGASAQPRGEMAWLIIETTKRPRLASGPLARAIDLLDSMGTRSWPVAPSIPGEVRRALDLASRPPDWIRNGELSHVLAALLLSIVRELVFSDVSVVEPVHRDIRRTLTWIDQNLNEVASAAELVAISGLSSTRFFEAFRAATGTTPKDYVMRRKTDSARHVLADQPDVTVTELAHSLGFSSAQQFATVFRRYQGMTPTEARSHPPHTSTGQICERRDA